MAKKKTLNYYKDQASKWQRSAKKQKDLREAFTSGVEKGIQLAKEARD
jgi:hypothetical protein